MSTKTLRMKVREEEIIEVDVANWRRSFYNNTEEGDGNDTITKVTGMYKVFLDYASM
jgi:topoisomerase-4 subunit A